MHTASLLIFASIIASILSSKILYISPLNAPSHHMWNTFLVTELAKRGHQLTYISGLPLKGEPHPNIENAVYQQSERSTEAWVEFFVESYFGTLLQKAEAYNKILLTDCEEMFKSGPYKDLADPKKNASYDLVIIEYLGHDCLLPFSQRFGSPPLIFTVAVTYNPHWLHRIAGVPLFPLIRHIIDNNTEPSSIWDRLHSTWFYLQTDFNYFTSLQPAMEKLNQKHFGQDVLPLKQLHEKMSLSLINVPDWCNKIPLSANVIPIGGIHLMEPKPLNSDLKKFMDEAKSGVILISFGTCVPTQELAVNTFRNMAAALGQLPQKVIWKWDPHMPDDGITFPENILRLPWIPQNDILGHPNTRLFISHCGGQSSLEAMFHGVPVLGVPGFYDQNGNADRLVAEEAALRLNFHEITESSFLLTIQELVGNPKFSEGALRLKNSLRDQPTKPLERAIFWIEYVIRHKGATHLRPLLKNVPYNHLLIFDVAVATIVSMIVLAVVFKTLLFLLRGVKHCFAKKLKSKSD